MKISFDATDVIPASVIFSKRVRHDNWSKAHLLSVTTCWRSLIWFHFLGLRKAHLLFNNLLAILDFISKWSDNPRVDNWSKAHLLCNNLLAILDFISIFRAGWKSKMTGGQVLAHLLGNSNQKGFSSFILDHPANNVSFIV